MTSASVTSTPTGRITPAQGLLWLGDDQDPDGQTWQARWAAEQGAMPVLQHTGWQPLRGDWLVQLESAVRQQPHCHLMAHDLGCALVAAWASYSSSIERVRSALLLAPFCPDASDPTGRYRSWRPLTPLHLPFPACVLVDPLGRSSQDQQHDFAHNLGAQVLTGKDNLPHLLRQNGWQETAGFNSRSTGSASACFL